MRNEIKELSVQLDLLEKNLSVLGGILSPITLVSSIGVIPDPSFEPNPGPVRSEVSMSILALIGKVKSMSSRVDNLAKSVDLGE